MKKSIKTLIIFSALLLFCSNAFAKRYFSSGYYIGHVKVICPCDVEFLQKTFNEKGDKKIVQNDPDGKFFCSEMWVSDDNTMKIHLPVYNILDDSPHAKIEFPFFARFAVDPDTRYYYIGDWTVTIDPYTFEIKDLTCEDNFDEAKEWFATQREGKKNADKMIRVEELLPLAEDD